MPYLQKKSTDSKSEKTHAKPYWYVRVPTGHGFKTLNTGTTDKKTAKAIESMVESLYRGARRNPSLLHWLLDRQLPVEQRLKPLTLLTSFEHNELDELMAKRAADIQETNAPVVVNVNDYVDAWRKDVTRRSSVDHAARFLRALRSFVAEGVSVPPERFSHASLLDWANSLQASEDDEGLGLSAETARRYRVGLLNFIEHLVDLEVLSNNQLAKIAPPKKGRPRDKHLTTSGVLRLIASFADSANEPLQRFVAAQGLDVCELQGFNALLNGAGVEVSVALDLRVHDVRLDEKEVRAPGTKTHNRDRVVRVAEWAMPFVTACVEGRAPHEKVFATIRDRWIANDVFNLAIAPLVKAEPETFGDYWMRDARHTYAVRAIRAGTPPHVVAKQLGHADATLVHEVYGVYAPTSVEREHWEQVATTQDVKTRQLANEVAVTPRGPLPERPTADMPMGPRKSKIDWPAKDELLRRLAASSALAVADALGVSDVALRKHLQRQGVSSIPDGRRGNVSRRPASS
ncbi:hypothetical protein BH09GEM1_BH09GEM1_06560 [soil metagenome]